MSQIRPAVKCRAGNGGERGARSIDPDAIGRGGSFLFRGRYEHVTDAAHGADGVGMRRIRLDLAAQVAAMDLVISIDNSTVHMAGALGVPVWVLLPYAPNWRWLLDREDSPWYPSALLIRQPRADSWDLVIETVRQRLSHGLLAGVGAAPQAVDGDSG